MKSITHRMKPHIFKSCLLSMALLILCLPSFTLGEETVQIDVFNEALTKLTAASMQERSAAVEQLAAVQEPRAIVVLQALLDGHLLKLKNDGKLVIGTDNGTGYQLNDAKTGQDLGRADREATQKITVNNSLRTSLRKTIGRRELMATDAKVRIGAVHAIAKAIDQEGLVLLRDRLAIEPDSSVQDEIKLVLGLEDLNSMDKTIRLAAIDLLKNHATQDVVNRLNTLVEKNADGNYAEADADVRNQAKTALVAINSRLKLYAGIETLFFGLSLGAVLVLAAIGLAITFGVMGVINMAHGELMMLGAYTTYMMQQLMPNSLGWSLILSIPAAFMISALVGIAIERGIIRFLYGRPLETLLATFGVSLFLQQTVRSIFSPLNRSVATPEWMSGTWQINDFLSLTWNRLYILVFCLLVFALLLQILKHTRLGLEVRAVAQNRGMAKAMGVPTARVDALTFGLGSGIAGVAGVALSQITNVGPNLGQAYIVDSFMVVVFGGVGNLWGTLLAGFTLGIANKLLEPVAGAVLAKILVLVFIILFIQKRPRGLFPQKGRAAES
ncbi:putative urea short-chain amide or branched-chain amino acid uptake ABC transporter permease protein, possibly fusion [Methyloglobulus morosus KoM1]|uniref:Putative urea short-chain amide or branched-chain amino acid uptake ABC transporter permease protein, possibly fusion n=2 Tax=Methyloglobulus TaxID=1410680 RepID=V5BX47_9GAMM|nr:putative urea short-chain amide or branched-chain amino acid uptake ABC transporter permease protein, possibly fusion [Methyloglobulus morosus KoM1]